MPYVMVPVPAEHEEEMTQFVLGLSIRAKLNHWADGTLETFVAGLDDTERSIVGRINEGALLGRPTKAPDLAEALGMDESALGAAVDAMAKRCWAAKWPTLVLTGKKDDPGPGAGSVSVTTYTIPKPVADRVKRALG